MNHDKAFGQGCFAYRHNLPKKANPYVSGSSAHMIWNKGYAHAKRESVAHVRFGKTNKELEGVK